ncbi:MAG: hypothetical protein QXE61_06080 [Nitrososphaerota archaeon]
MSKDRDLSHELRGKTLKVYLLLLKKGRPVGVREVQRELGFSSPSIAYHHLEKLKEMGVVSKDDVGRYVISEKVDVGLLKMFIIIRGKILPRLLFYAIFFTTLSLLYIFNHYQDPDLYALTFSVASTIAMWYETLKTWRGREW